MRLTRDRLRHTYRRANVLGKQAWDTTERVLNVVDRGTTLAAHGLLALGDRLDPEVRVAAGNALVQYGRRRQHIDTVKGQCTTSGASGEGSWHRFLNYVNAVSKTVYR